jgi:hypothetical protein
MILKLIFFFLLKAFNANSNNTFYENETRENKLIIKDMKFIE